VRIQISLELIICVAGIILGTFAYLTIGWAESTASPFLLNQERAMGALDYSSLPRIYALALVACCAANILLMFTKRNQEQQAEEAKKKAATAPGEEQQRVIRFRTLGTLFLVIVYSLLLKYVPFLYLSMVFLLVMFWVYGQRNFKITIPISVIGALCLWGLFIKLASLPLGN
jgi:hypothetical protein